MNIYDFIPQILDVKSNLTVFEIGCHFCHDTKKLREIMPNATIYCFDPDPRNIEYIISNNIEQKLKINFYPIAIGDKNCMYKFHLSSGGKDGNWSMSSSLKRPTNHLKIYTWCKFEKIIDVDCISLDSFCYDNNIKKIDFIWMDTQGAEDLIISGGSNILQKTRMLYTEYSNEELYENQISFDKIIQSLPGNWSVIHVFERKHESDVLLKNDFYDFTRS